MLLLIIFAFVKGKFISYSDEESRNARLFANSAQKEIESMTGFTILEQTMTAKPNKAWGISFLFKYDNSEMDLTNELQNKGWIFIDKIKQSNYVSQAELSRFCQRGVLLQVSFYQKFNSMQLGFSPDVCSTKK